MQKHVLFIHGAGRGAYAEDQLMAEALQSALGKNYTVHCPSMPDEENSPYELWRAEIEKHLAALPGAVALVGHSVGGSVLLKFLVDAIPAPRIAGLFVIAAPFWGKPEGWQWEDVELPHDAAVRLEGAWPLVLYHSRDDEIVPFSHVLLYAARLPRVKVRAASSGGHQFDGNLGNLAEDIRTLTREA